MKKFLIMKNNSALFAHSLTFEINISVILHLTAIFVNLHKITQSLCRINNKMKGCLLRLITKTLNNMAEIVFIVDARQEYILTSFFILIFNL